MINFIRNLRSKSLNKKYRKVIFDLIQLEHGIRNELSESSIPATDVPQYQNTRDKLNFIIKNLLIFLALRGDLLHIQKDCGELYINFADLFELNKSVDELNEMFNKFKQD